MCNNSSRKVCLVVASLLASFALAFGQGGSRTITGTVTDQNNDPLIGAGVVVEGQSTIGAVTDFNGNYSLAVPEGASQLRYSYIGMTDQVVDIAGRTVINVTLAEDTTVLEGVVVTALGIRKEAKALSYNVQSIKSAELTSVKDANFMNSLAGKVAGVQINASSSGIGGGVKVVMRGAKSISNNNNALYVIDGIPMPSLQTGQPEDFYTGMGQSGDGASMINPEDIENISVLSGAAASALYGSEAQNGVILITTRKGQEGALRVSYSNSTSFYSPFVTPEFQNTYGAAPGEFKSWGSKLAIPSTYNPLDFFQTGFNTTNAVTVSTGTEKNQTFLSMAATNAEGIVPNNKLGRYNFTIRNTTKLTEKLRMDLAAMFMNINEQNMVSEGQYMNPIVATYLLSPSYSLETYQLFEMYDESRGFKTQYWPWGNQGLAMQNPYWTINRDILANTKNRFMINGGLTYEIIKGLSLSARAKMDYTSGIYEKKYSASTDGVFAEKFGFYEKNDDATRQIYADVMLNLDKRFGDFTLVGAAGASFQDVNYRYFSFGGNLNSVANLFTTRNMNVSSIEPDESQYHDQVQSIFATAQLGWKSMLYLDVTGRIDWASALAGTGTSYVAYPSVGLTAILTEMIPALKGDFLSFLKLRGSYSEVGNAPKRFVPFQSYPLDTGTPATSTTYPNSDIKPERTNAWEVGLETHFWEDLVNLNVSLYKTSTFNQLFNPALPSSSGYSSIYINGGQIDNKGIEVNLGLNIPIGSFLWNSNITYSANRNKVVQLLKPTTLSNGIEISQDHLNLVDLGSVKTMITEGGSMGDLYVTSLQEDNRGYIYVDYQTNEVMKSTNAGPYKDGYIYAGNSQPKHMIGWRNNFAWKGLNLNFLITARLGGVGVSLTQGLMDAYGTSKTSADARDAGGVLVNGGLVPAAQKYYEFVGSGIGSMYVYDATNVRLQELSIGYDFPINKLIPWIQGLNLSLIGHNLLMFYSKAPYDPQLTASTATGFDGMDYFMLPSMRSLGFSAKVTFGGNAKKADTAAAPAYVTPYVASAPNVVEKIVEKEVVKEVPVEVVKEVVKEVVVAPKGSVYSEDINFGLGKTNLTEDEAFKLGRIFQTLEAYPDAKLTVTGYADTATGTAEINRRLSAQRVENVSKKLQEAGIPASRITVKVGEGDWDKNASPEANRRVTVSIVNE
ncbi:MAG: SusC/RagA family TonB-linked outer membrane protein [Bacteroidales bacterium]|nr:SusC/RagA family TonB-linked outer membrane protein [Bacteroidales bacterium]